MKAQLCVTRMFDVDDSSNTHANRILSMIYSTVPVIAVGFEDILKRIFQQEKVCQEQAECIEVRLGNTHSVYLKCSI